MALIVYFDGEDWVHLSNNLCLLYSRPVNNPAEKCLMHIPLFTRNYLPKLGDVIMDVGSGWGDELSSFSTMVGPSGHVYAIEADPRLHKKNLKIVELLGLQNVTCIQAAVMDKPGTIELGVFSDEGLDTSIHVNDAPETITVPATTLDKILDEYKIDHVDFLKMNIEGAEEYALQGISDLSRVKHWCISTHDFCGIPTKDFVVNFFTSKEIPVDIHEEVEDRSYMGGYVYIDGL